MTRHLLAIASIAILLTGCGVLRPGPSWDEVRKDVAIWDRIERRPYQPWERLVVACVQYRGTFTDDRKACMVRGKDVCYYLTAPGDVRHDPELTAFCNGFTPNRGKL